MFLDILDLLHTKNYFSYRPSHNIKLSNNCTLCFTSSDSCWNNNSHLFTLLPGTMVCITLAAKLLSFSQAFFTSIILFFSPSPILLAPFLVKVSHTTCQPNGRFLFSCHPHSRLLTLSLNLPGSGSSPNTVGSLSFPPGTSS